MKVSETEIRRIILSQNVLGTGAGVPVRSPTGSGLVQRDSHKVPSTYRFQNFSTLDTFQVSRNFT